MNKNQLKDTGERMIPPRKDEVSFVFARHRFAYEYAVQYVAEKTVLDVGCGTGYGCELFSRTAAFVCGIDKDWSAAAYSREQYGNDNTAFCCMDASGLAVKRQFDITVSFQIMEHVNDCGIYINELKRITKRGGLILISTPNVIIPPNETEKNPFHTIEFNFQTFSNLISTHFSSYSLSGVVYSDKNILRTIIDALPVYRLGKWLKRKSAVKKFADKTLKLTRFTMSKSQPEKFHDLFALCENR